VETRHGRVAEVSKDGSCLVAERQRGGPGDGGVDDSWVAKAIPWVRSVRGRPHGRSRRLGELGELVSRGRMADAYEAHDRLHRRVVAIEALAPAVDRVQGFVRRFPCGARAAADLS
jgi:hypothetical protein